MATTTIKVPQHLAALHRANEVRLARAQLKRDVAAGEVSIPYILAEVPSYAEGMPVDDLIMAQRRWGRTRTRKVLSSLALAEGKHLGTLTERQRRALAEVLGA